MKFCNFKLRSCLILIAFVFILKIDGINSFDDLAKRTYPALFLNAFPNKDYRFNTILAPFAFRNALLLSSIVAKGETKAQLETLLLKEKLEHIYHHTVFHNSTGAEMRLFVNQNTDVTECVKKKAIRFMEYVDFSTKQAKTRMDSYVKEKTNQMLQNIYSQKFDKKRSYLTLVYKEYLDIPWKKQFQEIIPQHRTFRGIYLSKPVMKLNDKFSYGNLTDLGVEAVVLPLRNGAKLLALQPYDILNFKDNFVSLKAKLLSVDFKKILKRLKQRKLSLLFPMLDKVKMERSTLPRVAQNLSIGLAFTEKANFGKLHPCGEDSFIDSMHVFSLMSTNVTSLRIASEIDLNVKFVNKNPTMEVISGEEDDYDDDERVEMYKDPPNVAPDLGIQTLLLRRFLFAVIQNDYAVFEGTLVKYHNSNEPI